MVEERQVLGETDFFLNPENGGGGRKRFTRNQGDLSEYYNDDNFAFCFFH